MSNLSLPFAREHDRLAVDLMHFERMAERVSMVIEVIDRQEEPMKAWHLPHLVDHY